MICAFNKSRLFIALSLLILLSACSPHPGAGNWQAKDSNSLNISRIHVVFEGTADFFSNGRDDSIRRCFWAATDKQVLQFQCVQSDHTEIKETYDFYVSPTGQEAELKRDGRLIGHFNKQAYESVDNEHKKNMEQQ